MASRHKRVILSIVILIFMTIFCCKAEEELDFDKHDASHEDNEVQPTIKNPKNSDVYDGLLLKSYRNAFLRDFIRVIDDSCRYLGKMNMDNIEDDEYKLQFFKNCIAKIDESFLRYQLSQMFGEQNTIEQPLKRDNNKVRFHSWGGKRDRSPKIVIRTPFEPWGGKKRSST